MEKRALVAAMISAVFLAWYSQVLMRWAGQPTPQRRPSGSKEIGSQTSLDALQDIASDLALYPIEKEEVILIKSEHLQLEIGKASGAIRRAVLSKFMDGPGKQPLQFGGELQLLTIRIGDELLTWHPIEVSANSATLESVDLKHNSYHISYLLDHDKPLVQLVLTSGNTVTSVSDHEVIITSTWTKGDSMSNNYNRLELFVLREHDEGKRSYKKYVAPWRGERSVPRGTHTVSLAEQYFCQSIRLGDKSANVTLLPSPEGTIAAKYRMKLVGSSDKAPGYLATVYIGPRDYFYLKKSGFESAFPIGMLGELGLILLVMLNWIAGMTKNYGMAIILFSGLITCATAPFTLLSFKSMKKMQELKPRIDKIMSRHKGDTAKANKEIFALYREHRISPLSSCLPMLLQMPIFIALFQAISHFIELRGKPFLWASDLSLPDRLFQLPFSVPFIGKDVNLLPIIMALAMYVQTKMSQGNISADQSNTAAKLMSGPLMSVVFGVMFYQFPSGLVLYWLTNSLISLVWYRLAK
jgi:YidC/Oxa1 family membrane protein insertase